MSRESRLIVVLLVMAGLGVSGLTFVANQYRKTLRLHAAPGSAGFDTASIRAVRLVDGFLAVRQAAQTIAARHAGRGEQESAYRIERVNALAAHDMSYEDYVAVRAAWGALRAGGPVEDPALLAALRARADELDEEALGPVEALDQAVD